MLDAFTECQRKTGTGYLSQSGIRGSFLEESFLKLSSKGSVEFANQKMRRKRSRQGEQQYMKAQRPEIASWV